MYMRLHILNEDLDDASGNPLQIVAGRNPLGLSSRVGSMPVAPEPLRRLSLAAGTSIFNADGSYWGDTLGGRADRFMGRDITLHFSYIQNPNAAGVGTAVNPAIVWISLEDISQPGPLYIVRSYEDEDGDTQYVWLTHGGRVTTSLSNPAYSNNFRLEFRNPPIVGGANATAMVAGTGTGNTATSANAQWLIGNATTLTEVRIVPVPGRVITGTGLNRTYRASAWMPLGEFRVYSDADEPAFVRLEIPLDHEYEARAVVQERHQIIAGHDNWHYIPVTTAVLTHEKDMGEDTGHPNPAPFLTIWEWDEHPTIPGRFDGIRILEGEELIANAPGYVAESGSPDHVRATAVMPNDETGAVQSTYMFMQRDREGRIYGFTLNHSMIANPGNVAVVPSVTVVIMDNATGQIAGETVSDSAGFFEVRGLSAGSYTVLGMRDQWGRSISVPTPVELELANGRVSNARVNIFMDQDFENYFPIFVRVNSCTQGDITQTATAALTYGTEGGSSRSSGYVSPNRVIWMPRDSAVWISTGVLQVGATGYIPQSFDISDLMAHPIDIPFLFVSVDLRRTIPNMEVRVALGPNIPRMMPLLMTTATLTYEGTNVAGTPPNSGIFTVTPYATLGNTLVASAEKFTSVTRVISVEDALHALAGNPIYIFLTEPLEQDGFLVRVVDEDGYYITTAELVAAPPAENYHVAASSGTGRIALDDVAAGHSIRASAAGFTPRTVIVQYHEVTGANPGTTIVLEKTYVHPFTVYVYEYVEGVRGNRVTTAALTHEGDPVTGTGGVFNISAPGVLIGDTLLASATGFNDATETVTHIDADRGSVVIRLIRRNFNLTLNNVPGDLTHSDQAGTAVGNAAALTFDGVANVVSFDAGVSLTAGDVSENHYFLGWYRGTTAPPVGTLVSMLDQDRFASAEIRTFNKPAADTQYFALWGARGEVGALSTRLTFHTYGEGYFQVYDAETGNTVGVTSVIVPVIFGYPLCSAAMQPVLDYLEAVDEVGAFAFWGWFTNAALDEAARPLRRGHRRPTVGATGFDISTVFTAESFNVLATDGNIDLHAIWSLWGDVNDDDRVDGADADILFWYTAGAAMSPFNRAAAKVTRGATVTGADADLLFWYVAGLPNIVLGRPVERGLSLAPYTVQIVPEYPEYAEKYEPEVTEPEYEPGYEPEYEAEVNESEEDEPEVSDSEETEPEQETEVEASPEPETETSLTELESLIETLLELQAGTETYEYYQS